MSIDLPEERRAQGWHQQETVPELWHGAECWCCCEDCTPGPGGGNPFWDAAIEAQRRAATEPDQPP